MNDRDDLFGDTPPQPADRGARRSAGRRAARAGAARDRGVCRRRPAARRHDDDPAQDRGRPADDRSDRCQRGIRRRCHFPHRVPTSRRASSAGCSRRTACRRFSRRRSRTRSFPSRSTSSAKSASRSIRATPTRRGGSSTVIARSSPTGQLVRLRDEFGALQRAIEYRFRDRGLLEHAMTHTSRANEDVSGGVTDNESLEFLGDAVLGFIIADLLFREFPASERRPEVEDQGVARLDDAARAAGRASGARRSSAARPRRGEDRRPAQAGAAGRRLRSADRGDSTSTAASSRRARSSPASSRRSSMEARAHGLVGQNDYKSALQEFLQSHGRPLPEYRLAGTVGPGSSQAVSGGGGRERRGDCAGQRAEQERGGAGRGSGGAGET